QEVQQIKEMASHIDEARLMADNMDRMCDEFSELEGREMAMAYQDELIPCIEGIREHLDALEMIVDDQMWPLPKYRELLFIR
ncbi:MAG: glutamine synthetase type III, partial [Candidatus Methanoplasma sp.]|nr:glutamine synthetase type III [Candidatus Methanoplasma sp.]